jgi:transcriptional regulator with XRE-family HTH domain
VFGAELGRRLRQLRLKARLTQRELAETMGRKPRSAHPVISKLEKGHIPSPGIGLIADFLRACRAGFADISDILERYTSQPSVPDKQVWEELSQSLHGLPQEIQTKVLKYDVKTKVARRFGPHPHKPGRKLAAAWFQRRKLDARLMDACNELKVGWNTAPAMALKAHARKVWGIMARTRTRKGEARLMNEQLRGDQLAQALADALFRADAPRDAVVFVHEDAVELFKLMERKGELDHIPSRTEIEQGRRARRKQARDKRTLEALTAYQDPLTRLRAVLTSTTEAYVLNALQAEGMEQSRILRYSQWLRRLYDIVAAHLYDPAGMKAAIERHIDSTSDPAEARDVAARFLKRLHTWLPRMRKEIPRPSPGSDTSVDNQHASRIS